MSFDAVVIGAGHNGLTCAAYLARAGRRVLVLEQYHDPGGMTISEELTAPGFLSDVHASGYLVAKLSPAPEELDLRTKGLELITPDPNWGLVSTDGTTMTIGRDPDHTQRELARFSAKDAQTWRQLYERYLSVKSGAVAGMYSPPASPAAHLEQLTRSAGGMDEYRFELQTSRSWVNETFEHDAVRAFVASFTCHAAASPDDVGGGEFAWLFLSTVQDIGVSIVKGGMHHVSLALVADIEEHGGEIRTGSYVERIAVRDGRATAVHLRGGEEIPIADGVVASNADPYHLVVDLLGEDAMGADIVHKMQQYEWGDSFFTIHVALDQPVAFAAGDDVTRCGYTHVAPPGVEDLSLLFTQCRSGELPAAPMIGVVNEGGVDPGRVPAGTGLMKFVVHFVPYEIKGDATGRVKGRTWDEAKEDYADHIVDLLTEAALPGLRDHVVHRHVSSPLDLERRLPSSVHGTHQHGAFVPYQHGSMRPIPELGHYRAGPIENVYLCGAGSHPGSGVTMAPGRIAAEVICDDLGIEFPGRRFSI